MRDYKGRKIPDGLLDLYVRSRRYAGVPITLDEALELAEARGEFTDPLEREFRALERAVKAREAA